MSRLFFGFFIPVPSFHDVILGLGVFNCFYWPLDPSVYKCLRVHFAMGISYVDAPMQNKDIISLLHSPFKEWFVGKFGSFTLPQRHAFPIIHGRQSVLVSAPTGSGKTLSAFGSVLNEMLDLEAKGKLENRVYCIYVSPLKALNNDVEKNLKGPIKEIEDMLGRDVGLRVGVRTGDTTAYEKQKMVKNPPHILITTPESLAIVLSSVKFCEHLKGCEWLIVDEIHSLAENKRGVHLSLTMERLSRTCPGLTRIGLSATVSPLDEVAQFLVGSGDCKVVDVQFIKEYDFAVMSPVKNMIDTDQRIVQKKLYDQLDSLIQEHRTTLIFTNTRAATERIVHHLKDRFPKNYEQVEKGEVIGAHHGSLSKEHRSKLEKRLKEGKLKCVVCSTSLELGIDIGFVDLVVCLGSPKSVSRLLQRAGRAGHALDKVTKARVIVTDRDDLVECSVMLKAALEKKIDRIHIPRNCLDVLAQHVVGLCLEKDWEVGELYDFVRRSYCYHDLVFKDYIQILEYLSGHFTSLEERHVYAKIWYREGKVGRRGRMTRVIYMTNIGTIPDATSVMVKVGDEFIGTIEEAFLEKLKPGDVFVLGGSTYQFKYASGMVAQVGGVSSRPPSVPNWYSEMLPLSFDLANEIGKFRRLCEEYFYSNATREDTLNFIYKYLPVDESAGLALYSYFKEQYEFCGHIAHDRKLVLEYLDDEGGRRVIVHSLFGRRVNDCLSRALAYAISLLHKRDLEIGISDNGFYFRYDQPFDLFKVFDELHKSSLDRILKHAIDKSEVLRRRFRHCAGRSFMILRQYKGLHKRVGRQQVSSMILLKAVRMLDENFVILKEARREVLEDLMDIENAKRVLNELSSGRMQIATLQTGIASPFAFGLVLQGHLDIMRVEDRGEFLKRMHILVQEKISREKGSKRLLEVSKEVLSSVHFDKIAREEFASEDDLHPVQRAMLRDARKVEGISKGVRSELMWIIRGRKISDVDLYVLDNLVEMRDRVSWGSQLSDLIASLLDMREEFSVNDYCLQVMRNPDKKLALDKHKLLHNLQLVCKKLKVEPEVRSELLGSVEGAKISSGVQEWVREFCHSTVPKYCEDATFWHLRSLL